MNPWTRREHTEAGQKVSPFTGEGAYHGSTKPRPPDSAPAPVVAESCPATLDRYDRDGVGAIASFDASFPNAYRLMTQLPVPGHEDVRTEGVEFCWTPLDEAIKVAGPVTRVVLKAMQRHVSGTKRFAYVDSKIQFFQRGDLPVDSMLWHVDGVTAVRGPRAQRLGFDILHDMRARLEGGEPPRYMAYQSSYHCATEFLERPLVAHIPELVPNFDYLDLAVRATTPRTTVQPAGSVVAFNGLSLHRAVPATAPGWRLWVRLTETDREIVVDPAMLDCYGTVFRTGATR